MKTLFRSGLSVLPALLTFLILSCQQGFVGDPRLYNKKEEVADAATPVDDLVVEDSTPENQDPFINGEWNDIEYGGFSGDVFLSWVLNKVNFSNQNIPSYRFATSGKSWAGGDASKNEYTYNAGGEGNKAQGYSINPMTVFQYRSKNPLVSPTSSYNKTGGKMERFYFHRIKGESGGGIAQLDQYLIAVDIRSKFVFAYAKVTATKNLLGNNMPIAFAPMENYGEQRPFYQYDPIGYVTADGSVILYPRYEADMIATKAVNFEPTIHKGYTAMATHNPNGEGRSPYFGLTTADDAQESFKNNMQDIVNNEYKRREGMYLYTYKIVDNETIVRTGEKWNNTEEVPEKTFKLAEAFSGITAYFTADGETYTVNLKDKETQITFREESENEEAPENEQILREVVAYRNFVDKGPAFVAKVAGQTFQYTSVSERGKLMMFSEDGMTLTDQRTGKTYTLSSEGSETRAKYKSGGMYYPLELSQENSLIKWGTGFPIESWVSYGTCNYNPASIIREDAGSFHENVAGCIFSVRDGLFLYNLKFSPDGKTATLETEEWRTNKVNTLETWRLTEDGSETATTATYGNRTFTITDLSAMSTVESSDGRTYDKYYEDPEPEFLLRVQNDVSFANDGDNNYMFTNDGRTLVMDGDTYTYDSQNSSNNRAVYTKKDMVGVTYYYGVELSTDNGVEDNKIKMTHGAWGTGTIIWSTLGCEAYRGFEVTDSFASNAAGKVYHARDGLNLYTYTFSDDGRSVSINSTLWRENTVTDMGTLNWQSQSDGENAVYAKESGDSSLSDKTAFAMSDAGKYLKDGNLRLERSDTFSDPEPEFLLRVQNDVSFANNDGDTYSFTNGGRTLVMNDDTYTYVRQGDPKNRAVYRKDTSQVLKYYGVELSDGDDGVEDNKIKMTSRSAENAIQWHLLRWEAYRQ